MKSHWESNLQYSDWYIRLEKELNKYFFPVVHDDPSLKKSRHEIYDLIENYLSKDKIPLANEGPHFDEERKKIDTIIIHHTEEDPGMTKEKLSAIGLVRLYAPKYLANDVRGHKLRGEPLWSGHFMNDKQVFYGYHWLIRINGDVEQLLDDKYIGWHSGIWDINTRSIGIALSGNYEHSSPPLKQIESAAKLIKNHYCAIDKVKILGHREVKEGRTCPGDQFLSHWKQMLLKIL